MSRLCLDTSAFSHFRRGERRVVELIDEALWVGLPAIVLGELRTGFALGRQRAANEQSLQAFMSHPVVEVLDVDDAASKIYAELVLELRRAGTPLPTNDIWIAAVAAREGATVVSYDAHFSRVRRIGLTLLER
jgi:tRNA(fMet)-specific endonuclease VapC